MALMIWLIAIALILVIFMFLKTKDMRHKIFAIVMVFLLLFLYISVTKVYSSNSVDLTTFEGVVDGGKIYFSWLGHTLTNVKEVTGKVISLDWGGNSSKNSTKK
ncbi:MAG: hypothetical protein ABIE22_03290 [archaeon]